IRADAQLVQFEIISNTIIRADRERRKTEEPFLLLDETRFETLRNDLKARMPTFYSENQEACDQEIKIGMRLGADDILRLLRPTPTAEGDSHYLDEFFTPWREDLLDYITVYPMTIEDSDNGG